ncbi:MAG: nitroreductase family protein [Deltaproteobacteria bacterium]|nr:nitroreductase family protein [Deltaproteobacteria bacterium]
MLHFKVDEDKCTKCGLCAQDCPINIIDMDSGYPGIFAGNEGACLKCQHCLAICPTAALSILGREPEDNVPLKGAFPDPDCLEILIKGRRSVRWYLDENLEPEILQRLLNVAWHAPSGANDRQVRFSVIDDKRVFAAFREEVYGGLAKRIKVGKLPEGKVFFAEFVRLWQEEGVDALFLDAPHFLVASSPRACTAPVPDCLIALSYFELFAQSLGVGTLWAGLAKWAIDDLVPELRERLKIPQDHVIGFAMIFGKPAVQYQRTVEYGTASFVRVSI